MRKDSALRILALLGLVSACSSFQTIQNRRQFARVDILQAIVDEGQEDFPAEEDAGGSSVDWDAEWKKVVASDGKLGDGVERPGKGYYKSEAEITAIKATNKAAAKAAETASNIGGAMPDVRSLSGDWKVR